MPLDLEVKDLLGLSEPLSKLIDVVSKGVGTLYLPVAIKKQADAKAYEIRALAEANSHAQTINYESESKNHLNRIASYANNDDDLLNRAKLRLLTREIEGQKNVEAIAENAANNLPETVSENPVSEDWRRKFFLEAENICDADLQLLWGKILAGEVSSPGTYSLRTLEVVKGLSKGDAELFSSVCSLAFPGWALNISNDLNVCFKDYGITYTDILDLRDAGLVADGDNLHRDMKSFPPPFAKFGY